MEVIDLSAIRKWNAYKNAVLEVKDKTMLVSVQFPLFYDVGHCQKRVDRGCTEHDRA